MDLRQLEYFAAVARHRHFRRAAEDLYVTQSAVSQQIRRLEAELGLALLRRTSRGVELTPAGAELLTRAEAILADVAGARAAMDEHAGALRGSVRLAASTGDAMRLPPALARFQHEHPGVRIALRQGLADDVLALLQTGSVDLAVGHLNAPPDLRAEPLAHESLILIVAEEDALAGASDVQLWDLRERPFILTEPGTALRDLVVDACAGAGFGPVPPFEVSDPTTVRFLVQAGLGVSLVPASWLAHAGPPVGSAALAPPAPVHAPALLSRPGALSPVAGQLRAHLLESLG